MAKTFDDEATLMAAAEAWEENRTRTYRKLLGQLAHRERALLEHVWERLESDPPDCEAGLVQVAVDVVSKRSVDILEDLWPRVKPSQLLDLISITRNLLPKEYCWINAIRSLSSDPLSGREHVVSLGSILKRWRSRQKRQELVEDLLARLDDRLVGPSLVRLFMDIPSAFVSTWILRHIRQILSDGVDDPEDVEWNGVPSEIASVLLAGGIEWEAVQKLLRPELDRERRVGAYILAGHLGLKSGCLHEWMAPHYKPIEGAPSRAECRSVLLKSNLLVACDIRGLG